MHMVELTAPPQAPEQTSPLAIPSAPGERRRGAAFRQLLRFGLVGGLNTLIDVLALNALLWLHPTSSTGLLLMDNAIAYGVGAVNSFFFNKYWTFRCPGRARRREVGRFTLMTLAGMVCNTLLLWMMSTLLHPVLVSAVLWANASKVVAIAGTVLISYLGMRLWVFVRPGQQARLS
jgi:putative flippase GtrA